MTLPAHPKIYHIAHVDNLPTIIAAGGLISDAAMRRRGCPSVDIGNTQIKRSRLTRRIRCHPGHTVGDYVPFYFCSRSIMLYVIYCANHPGLTYHGGQNEIVHLEADLHTIINWADQNRRSWAFSTSNAQASYTAFYKTVEDLDKVNWSAVAARMWNAPETKEAKQAEFLVHEKFPWELISRIGVKSMAVATKVNEALRHAAHRPVVEVKADWYY